MGYYSDVSLIVTKDVYKSILDTLNSLEDKQWKDFKSLLF